MARLTKKYIFEQKLNGKPIIILVEEGQDRWATEEDLKLLLECGILLKNHGRPTIVTHEILTYTIPCDLDHGPIARLSKGQGLPVISNSGVTS